MMTDAPFIGAAEAAEIVGVSVDTIKRYARTGALRYAVKMPGATGAYLFARETVERFATERAA